MAIYPRVIYMITHDVTGRMYIGSTGRFETRVAEHMAALRLRKHPNKDMQSDFNSYGDHFTVKIIGEIKSPNESKKEYEMMEKYHSQIRGVGYNYNDVWPRVRTTRTINRVSKPERKSGGYRNARAEMVRAGQTLKMVAEKMGCSISILSEWLNDKSPISVANAVKFKKAINSDLPLEVLFEKFEEAS